jgi:class 3 adenylate cyclase
MSWPDWSDVGSVRDGTGIRAGSADVPVRGPLRLHSLDRGPRGRAGAADLVGGFCVAVRQLLAEHQAHEVKAIGDALMIRAGDAAAAIRLGLCIVHDVGAQHGIRLVRVGMHTGPAVERAGDWFGATVNLAARLSAAAASDLIGNECATSRLGAGWGP